MIKLCGFALSNYYNKVKFVLLEHGIEFEEVFVQPSQDEAVVAHSPLGKVPYLQTEDGDLCESQCIVEYLAARFPENDGMSASLQPLREAISGSLRPALLLSAYRRSTPSSSPRRRRRRFNAASSRNCRGLTSEGGENVDRPRAVAPPPIRAAPGFGNRRASTARSRVAVSCLNGSVSSPRRQPFVDRRPSLAPALESPPLAALTARPPR